MSFGRFTSSAGIAILITLGLTSPLTLACTAGTVLDGVAESTPNTDFVDGGNGTVIHLKTGLIWKRCLEGQDWVDNACVGEPYRATWSEALQISAYTGGYAGTNDWRVPNRKELESIVEYCGHSPAINLSQFPPTPAARFWSSTSAAETPDLAWDVYFSDGFSGLSRKSGTASYLRLVRTAPAGSLLIPQQISFGALPNVAVGGSATLTATSSASLPVVLSSLSPAICSVSGFTVSGLAEGSCTIAANQAGSATVYPAAQATAVVNVGRQPQTISLSGVGSIAVGASATVLATASSGLTVSLSTSTPAICRLNGSVLTGLAAGTCAVLAAQGGDATYRPATTASLSILIGSSGGADQGSNPGFSYPQSLNGGWNLLGNSLDVAIDARIRFADAARVESVWKWDAVNSAWAFFSPALSDPQLQSYLVAKNFQPLSEIRPGEAFWLKLKQPHDFGSLSGNPVALGSAALLPGWNLVTTGEEISPAELNLALATTPPAAGTVPQSFVSLWAWDSALSRWYFYSPALEAQGPTRIKEYTDSRGFLDFSTEQKKIGKGSGFWIRK